ncbi:hypothetical protein [Bradyrhizobium sp. USDA 3364]
MLEFLIVVLVAGVGFVSGYGVRELISRRKRRSPLPVHAPEVHAPHAWRPRPRRDDTGGDADAILAANDDISARSRHRASGLQQADLTTPPDELDCAVRDLLGELSRRIANPSETPQRRRQ